MTVENISWSIPTKECCRPSGGRTRNLLIFSRTSIQLSHRGQDVDPILKMEISLVLHERDGWKKYISAFWCPLTQTTSPLSGCTKKLEVSGSNNRWEICDGFLWERMKNGQTKGMISSRMLTLSYTYTIQQVKPNVWTNFQNPVSHGSWEIFDTNFPMPYIWVRDGKWKTMEKEGKINHSSFSFT